VSLEEASPAEAADSAGPAVDGSGAGAGARTWGGWVVLSAVVGVVLGMVWALVAPRVDFEVSGGEFLRVAAQPEEYFVGDLVLGVMLALAGAALAVVWWRRGQQRPLASMLGLVTGGVVALSIAVLVGQGLAGGPVSTEGLADGVVVQAGLQFRSWAMIVWWPTAVVVLFAVALAGAAPKDSSGR
jgi:hypothetical protein